MRHWWEAGICPCCNIGGHIEAAYSYWSEKLYALSDNPYTHENADEIFASVVCEIVQDPGVAGLIVEFFTRKNVNRSDKDRLVSQIIHVISEDGNVEDWLFKERTQMKGDISLILTLLEEKGILRHQCPCDEHLHTRRWFTHGR